MGDVERLRRWCPPAQHIANLSVFGHPGTAYGPFQLPRSLREGEVIESAPDSPARRSLMADFAALSPTARKGHTKPRTNNNGRSRDRQ